jgi:hypothetical protein
MGTAVSPQQMLCPQNDPLPRMIPLHCCVPKSIRTPHCNRLRFSCCYANTGTQAALRCPETKNNGDGCVPGSIRECDVCSFHAPSHRSCLSFTHSGWLRGKVAHRSPASRASSATSRDLTIICRLLLLMLHRYIVDIAQGHTKGISHRDTPGCRVSAAPENRLFQRIPWLQFSTLSPKTRIKRSANASAHQNPQETLQ